LASGADYGLVCSWGFYWGYWQQNHSTIIVRKPSKDMCGLCYQFHLGDRTTTPATNRTPVDNDDSSLHSDDGNEDDDEDGRLMEEREQETQRIANEIKQHIKDATAMRGLCQTVIQDAKTATRDNFADEDMVITLVAN
jgi:hypothetical protein